MINSTWGFKNICMYDILNNLGKIVWEKKKSSKFQVLKSKSYFGDFKDCNFNPKNNKKRNNNMHVRTQIISDPPRKEVLPILLRMTIRYWSSPLLRSLSSANECPEALKQTRACKWVCVHKICTILLSCCQMFARPTGYKNWVECTLAAVCHWH